MSEPVPVQGIHFFTIHTKDLASAKKFYLEDLGLHLSMEKPGEFFQFTVAGVTVYVDLAQADRPVGNSGLGIAVKDLGLAMTILQEKGIQVETGFNIETHESWASIQDPDGNDVIFVQVHVH